MYTYAKFIGSFKKNQMYIYAKSNLCAKFVGSSQKIKMYTLAKFMGSF